MNYPDDREQIRAIRAQLTQIAQQYNAAGMAILDTLYPGGYATFAKMPESLSSLDAARALVERLRILEREVGS